MKKILTRGDIDRTSPQMTLGAGVRPRQKRRCGICLKTGILLVLATVAAFAQNPPVQPPPALNASSLNFPVIVPAMDPIANASVSLIGNPGPARYCYWIVTNYLVGNTTPVKIRPCITNGPITLSSSNYDQISFNLPPQAVSADILRTSGTGMDQAPQGSCACAVATANTTSTVQDQSNSLSAYTVTTFDPSVLNIGLTNVVVGAGASHLKLFQNNQLIGDISALANGLADPGASGIVFRTTANTTRVTVLGDVTALGSTGTGNLVLANAPNITSPALTTPNIGAASGTSLALTGQATVNSGQTVINLFCVNGAGVTLNGNTSSAQFPLSCTFPANQLNAANKSIEFFAEGNFTPVNTTQTISWALSSTTGFIQSAASIKAASTLNHFWSMAGHCIFDVDINPVHCSGNLLLSDQAAGGTDSQSLPFGFVESGISLTSSIVIGVGVSFGTASTSNSVRTDYLNVRQEN